MPVFFFLCHMFYPTIQQIDKPHVIFLCIMFLCLILPRFSHKKHVIESHLLKVNNDFFETGKIYLVYVSVHGPDSIFLTLLSIFSIACYLLLVSSCNATREDSLLLHLLKLLWVIKIYFRLTQLNSAKSRLILVATETGLD